MELFFMKIIIPVISYGLVLLSNLSDARSQHPSDSDSQYPEIITDNEAVLMGDRNVSRSLLTEVASIEQQIRELRSSRGRCSSHRDCRTHQYCSCHRYCHHIFSSTASCYKRRRKDVLAMIEEEEDFQLGEPPRLQKSDCSMDTERFLGRNSRCDRHSDCNCGKFCSCHRYCVSRCRN